MSWFFLCLLVYVCSFCPLVLITNFAQTRKALLVVYFITFALRPRAYRYSAPMTNLKMCDIIASCFFPLFVTNGNNVDKNTTIHLVEDITRSHTITMLSIYYEIWAIHNQKCWFLIVRPKTLSDDNITNWLPAAPPNWRWACWGKIIMLHEFLNRGRCGNVNLCTTLGQNSHFVNTFSSIIHPWLFDVCFPQ